MAQLNQKVLGALERIRLDPVRVEREGVAVLALNTRQSERLALHAALPALRSIIEGASAKTGVSVHAILGALSAEEVEIQMMQGEEDA